MNEVSLTNSKNRISLRKIILIAFDIFVAASMFTLTNLIFLLYSSNLLLPIPYLVINASVMICCIMLARYITGIYKSVWRYANTYSYLKLVISDFCAGLVYLFVTMAIRSIYMQGFATISVVCVVTLATLSSRFVYQQYHYRSHSNEQSTNKKNVAIVGAGQVGVMLANELQMNSLSKYNPYCFVDTNRDKVGNKIHGINVIEADGQIVEKLRAMPIEEIIIALPKLDYADKQKLYDVYKQTGRIIKIYDFAFGQNSTDEKKRVIRNFKIEELLFRDPIEINEEVNLGFYKGKRILVTGGGGSIGSELCRQIAKRDPGQLVILDIYENNAYEIQQELVRQYGEKLNLAVEIATVRDRERLENIFRYYNPQIVFHAAAHKHVPLMEHNPGEAVKNNVIGTYNTADMAEKYGAEKFIMISSDKAVNPTNVMGASKRMCEMIIQSRHDSNTSFTAVRFGNVLGSNGSVIPLFKKQIEEGGPVTITDKRIIRYFMTISEASQLVMQAGIMAQSGDLFVLDMGKPVKILDLAENIIRLSNLVPYKDIDIVDIGLRPGEKLYEELLIKGENLTVTSNKKIFIEKDTPLTRKEIEEKLDILKSALEQCNSPSSTELMREAIKKAVNTFSDPEKVNGVAHEAEEMKICNGEEDN